VCYKNFVNQASRLFAKFKGEIMKASVQVLLFIHKTCSEAGMNFDVVGVVGFEPTANQL
jgi:hypothetical protein